MASASPPIGHNLASNSNHLNTTRTRYLSLLSHTYETSSAGEILQCSTHIAAQYWDQRKWQHNKVRWPKNRTHALLTAGFKNWVDKVGNPKWPNRVWHPMGLFPTCLASGNTGLVSWPRLRWMCSKHSAFLHWANTCSKGKMQQPASRHHIVHRRTQSHSSRVSQV